MYFHLSNTLRLIDLSRNYKQKCWWINYQLIKSNRSKRQSLDIPGCFAHGHQHPSRQVRQNKKVLSDFSLAVTSKSNQLPIVDSTSSISG